MIGAIVGDIIGSRFEFDNYRGKDFELFTPENSYTDDTICTLAVADAIMSGQPFSEALRSWCSRYPHPMGGYGGRFSGWILAGDAGPYGSWGNGAAMRVSPCAWLFDGLNEVVLKAKESAECTHDHPEGIRGAQCVAACIYLARHKASRADIRAMLTEEYRYSVPGTVAGIRVTNSFDESCLRTVPPAVVCFLESTGYEDAIRNAVSIGGDTDTIAAITGSIAEAYYGIPGDICKTAIAYLDGSMTAVVDRFTQATAKR
jgi:ADP-ribosylglycohydrolase